MPRRPVRIPVTGSRTWTDKAAIAQAISNYPHSVGTNIGSAWPFPAIVHGAARGTDQLTDAAGLDPSHIPPTGTITTGPPDTDTTQPWSPSAPTCAWPSFSTTRPGQPHRHPRRSRRHPHPPLPAQEPTITVYVAAPSHAPMSSSMRPGRAHVVSAVVSGVPGTGSGHLRVICVL